MGVFELCFCSLPFYKQPRFNHLAKEDFWKTMGEKEKMLVTSIYPFPTMVSTVRKEIQSFYFYLLSANASNSVESKVFFSFFLLVKC